MSGKRAFTLIELLVVISIIALLVAILLPALGKARGTAQTVQCSKQMGQIVTANHLYAHEFKGYFTPLSSANYGSPPRVNWGQNVGFHLRLIPFLNATVTKNTAGLISGDVNTNCRDLARIAAMWCPSATNRKSPTEPNIAVGFTHHYGINANIRETQWENRRDVVKSPSRTFLHGEYNFAYEGFINTRLPAYQPDTLNPNHSSNQNTYRISHNLSANDGLANYGFCDGHVQAMRGDYSTASSPSMTPAENTLKSTRNKPYWYWW